MSEPITVFQLPALLLGVALNFCPGQQPFPLAPTFLALLDRLSYHLSGQPAPFYQHPYPEAHRLQWVGFHLL